MKCIEKVDQPSNPFMANRPFGKSPNGDQPNNNNNNIPRPVAPMAPMIGNAQSPQSMAQKNPSPLQQNNPPNQKKLLQQMNIPKGAPTGGNAPIPEMQYNIAPHRQQNGQPMPQPNQPHVQMSPQQQSQISMQIQQQTQLMAQTQQTQQTQQKKHMQENPNKKTKDIPKSEVILRELSFGEIITISNLQQCFIERANQWEMKYKMNIDKKALFVIALAMKLRMTDVVKQSVLYSQKRRNKNVLLEPNYTNIPLAQFALLETERRIINSKQKITPIQPEAISPLIEQYKNQALFGIAARLSGKKREKVASLVKETEETDQVVDQNPLVKIVPAMQKNPDVNIDDVYAFVENDMVITPSKLKKQFFNLQYRKVAANFRKNLAPRPP